MADQSIGIMQGAFFVPATELLQWINSILQLDVQKVEQLGTGAVYCQLFDMMYPGKINMTRVNWRARNEWEFIQNLKILQSSFEKCQIKKHIQIERLSKSKYQDNLQFIQWFKRFFQINGGCKVTNYDPKSRRNGQTDFSFMQVRINPRKRQIQQKIRRKGRSRSPILNESDISLHQKSKKRNYSLNHRYKRPDPKQQSKFYLNKLHEIKKILNLNSDENKQKQLQKIKNLMADIEQIAEEPNIEQSSNNIQSRSKKLKTFK